MELSVKTNDLAQVLRLTQAVTERKTTVPVLGTVLLTADTKSLVVTGTDLELGAVCRCAAEVKATGSLAIPARRLAEYVKILPEAELHLKQQASHWLALSCGRSRSRIAGVAAASYPELPSAPEKGIDLSCGILTRLVEKVIFAISNDESRFTLTGALLQIAPSTITMVASDGHRLALATSQVEIADIDKSIEVLIPKKALHEFLRFSEGRNDRMLRCAFTENHLFFAWGDQLLLSRKLNGSFPDYEKILPKQYERSMSLERDELRASVERVSRFSDSRLRCILLEASAGQLALRAAESNVGESEEVLPAAAYTGEQVEIGLNSSYLLDFLARTEHQDVRFFFRDGSSPAEFQPEAPSGAAGYRYVVMPMRI